MKINKTALAALSVAALAFTFSACDHAANTTSNNSTANIANKSNTAVVNSNQTTVNNATPASDAVSNTANDAKSGKTSTAPADDSETSKIEGELQVGKTESLILYVGMESGDYAAYCFANDSEAGRAILAACKDKGQCEVMGTSGEGKCEVPGLEADLSFGGRITKVVSAKPRTSKK